MKNFNPANRLYLVFLLFLPVIHISGQWTLYNSQNTSQILSNDFRSAAISDNGTLFFASANGLVSFDGINWTSYNVGSHNLAGNYINDLKMEKNGSSEILWTGTETGLSKISLQQGSPSAVENFTSQNSGLKDDHVYSIGLTHYLVKIFGTDGYVSVLSTGNWKGISDLSLGDSLALDSSPVKDINSSQDKTFLGTDGAGVFVCDNETDGISVATIWVAPYNIPPPIAHDLGGGNFKTNITGICLDENGNQWISTDKGLIFHEGLASQSGWGDYLDVSNGLPNGHINKLYIDSRQVLWIGTNGGGVVKMADGSITDTLEVSDGLPSGIITDIIEDQDQKLWFLGPAGLACYNQGTASGKIRKTDNEFELNLFPNPVTETVRINFRNKNSGQVRISVWSIDGSLLCILRDQYFISGEIQLEFRLSDILPESGMYILKTESRELSLSKTFVFFSK